MSLINVQNLTFGYYGSYKKVFENVSFQIDTDWKLGFVGRNGRGKTTFLKLLMGQYEYSGKISANVRFAYFPYAVKDKSFTVGEIFWQICPSAQEWEFVRELSYLNVDGDILDRRYDTLSYGEQTKVLLAALFLNENGYLLIDEPTNHLDGAARQTVARYLKGKKGFILVSHDRAFLDGCVDHILSINKTNLEITGGNFSCWLENFERRQSFEATQSEKLQREAERLSRAAMNTSAWADRAEASKYGKASSGLKQDKGYVGHKAAKVMKRAKAAEARQALAAENVNSLLRNAETSEKLKLSPLAHHSEKLVCLTDVQIKYDGKHVCKPVSLEIRRGERVCLDGGNGCGKSSLIKLIAGENLNFDGQCVISSGLIVSYIPQTCESLSGGLSGFAARNRIDESLLKAVLAKMGFEKDDFGADLSALSEGQKKKVLLAKSLCERAHIYVWDEPLNYIDIYSRAQIEEVLREYAPTMIFVEHDEAFKRAVATKTVKISKWS